MKIIKYIASFFLGGKQKLKTEQEDTSSLDKIFLCAKSIIEQGVIVDDNASSTTIPHVKFEDAKGNTLHISWFSGLEEVLQVEINDAVVPETHDTEIFHAAKDRIQVLRKEHLERVIDSFID